jgi:hypothetical protein
LAYSFSAPTAAMTPLLPDALALVPQPAIAMARAPAAAAAQARCERAVAPQPADRRWSSCSRVLVTDKT